MSLVGELFTIFGAVHDIPWCNALVHRHPRDIIVTIRVEKLAVVESVNGDSLEGWQSLQVAHGLLG